MSAKGIQDWLEAIMLDPATMAKAQQDIASTFSGYELDESERNYLKDPARFTRPDGMTPDLVRPMIIRYINKFGTTAPPTMIALVSELLRGIHGSSGGAEGLATKQGDPVESSLAAANRLVDALFAKSPAKPAPRRLLDQADITIVGLGMRSTDQLTPEAARALFSSKHIYYVDGSIGLARHLASKGVPCTDLSTLYAEGKDRLTTYKEMTKKVIEGALRSRPVAFALYGHPTVFAFPPFVVRQVAEALGLTVAVIPGVSAMDCLFAELMIDPATNGLQIYEATDLLLRRRTILPDVPLLLWQIGAIETGLYSLQPSSPGRFKNLLEHLYRFYPASHPCVAVYCTDHPAIPSSVLHFALGDIGQYAAQLHGGYTLYMPPLNVAGIVDLQLLAKLDSADHLSQITRS